MPSQDDGSDNNQNRLRHLAIIYSFISLYLLLFQFSMPPKSKEPGSPSKKPTAKITFLRSESDRIGGTSFKEASFTAAADHIKDLHTEGAIKTAAHCRTKWTSVSFLTL